MVKAQRPSSRNQTARRIAFGIRREARPDGVVCRLLSLPFVAANFVRSASATSRVSALLHGSNCRVEEQMAVPAKRKAAQAMRESWVECRAVDVALR